MEKQILEKYKQLRGEVDALDQQLKEKKANLEKTIEELHEYLAEKGATKTAVYEGIGSYAIGEPTMYCSVLKDDEDKLFGFLKENGREDLIKPSVHHRSLASFVKELLEDGKEKPEFIKSFYKLTGRFYGQ